MVFKTIEGKKEEKKNEDIVNYNLNGNMEPLSSKPNFKTGDLKVLVCFRGDICILSNLWRPRVDWTAEPFTVSYFSTFNS